MFGTPATHSQTEENHDSSDYHSMEECILLSSLGC